MNRDEQKQKLSNSTNRVKSITLADLLTDDQLDLLVELKEKDIRKTPPLRVRDLEMVFPIESRHGKISVRAFKVKLVTRNAEKAFQALLWHVFFGSKTFRVIHWYILFNYFTRTIRKNDRSRALLEILRITTQQCGNYLNQGLRPLKTVVSYFLGKEMTLKYIELLQKDLGVKLAHQKPDLTKLFHITETTLKQRKPPEPRRIGVGYKDKGHLPDSPREESLPDEIQLPTVDEIFVDLMESTKLVAAFAESYDPRKRKKLLDQFKSKFKT